MAHLQRMARIVYLDVPLTLLRERLGDLDERGVIHGFGQDLDGLFAERRPLYEGWADLRVDCDASDHDTAVEQILSAVAGTSLRGGGAGARESDDSD